MKKRGQLTILIIITIVLVISLFFYYTSSKNNSDKSGINFIEGKGLSEKTEDIRTKIINCIKETTKQSLIIIGVQGGNLNPPEKYYDIGPGFFSYYYYEGEFLMPSKTEITNSIEEYNEKNIEECFKRIDYPLKTKFTSPQVFAEILEGQVSFTINSILTIVEDDVTKNINLNEVVFTQESYLHSIIEIAEYLTEYHNTDPKYFCINCLAKIAEEKDLNVDIFEFIEENTTQVIIHEYKTNSPNIYMFTYLNKYTGNEISQEIDN